MKFTIKKNDFKQLMITLLGIMILYLFVMNSNVVNDVILLVYLGGFLSISFLILAINKYNLISVPVVFLVGYWFVIVLGPIVFELIGLSYFKYQLSLYFTSFILFYVGYYILAPILIRKREQCRPIHKRDSQPETLFLMSEVIFLVGVLATGIYVLKNREFLLSGSVNDGRVTAMSGNGIWIYLGKLMWLGVFICAEQFLREKKHKKIFYTMVLIAIVLSFLLGFRSAVVDAILVLLVMWNREKPIKKELLIFGCITLVVIFMCYSVIRSATGSSITDEIYNELRVGSVNFNNIVNTFPRKISFQHGYTYFINFIMILPGEDPDFTTWLKEALNLTFSGGGVTPTIMGEFYINWGYIGIFIGMLFTGIFFRKIQNMYIWGNSIFVPSLFIGYIRSFIRGGFANCFIIFIIYLVGYTFCHCVSAKHSVRIRTLSADK